MAIVLAVALAGATALPTAQTGGQPAAQTAAPAAAKKALTVDDVAVGDVVIVRPGQKVPLDATVVAGESDVNQAPITGESMPVGQAPTASASSATIDAPTPEPAGGNLQGGALKRFRDTPHDFLTVSCG
jgi:P-type E1-E2 ATPase